VSDTHNCLWEESPPVTGRPRRSRQRAVVLVALGGFAGATLRYLAELVVPSSLGATATVNVVGCLALGAVFYVDQYSGISPATKAALATGFLGSFTTYSTFVVDTLESRPAVAAGYLAGSYALGFGAVLLGRAGAHWLTSTEGDA
jgi:CrcB protein